MKSLVNVILAALVLAGCSADTPKSEADFVTVREAWIKSADSGMTSAFAEIQNTGSEQVRVVAAQSSASAMMALHEIVSASPVDALPAFGIDRLDSAWSGGDLLLQICAEDPVPVAHALRVLTKNVRSMASIRWVQRGFRSARGSSPAGTTMRNLMGQVDGTVNPDPTTDFDALVWNPQGGNTIIIRRIAVELDTWDELDRGGREFAVGVAHCSCTPRSRR